MSSFFVVQYFKRLEKQSYHPWKRAFELLEKLSYRWCLYSEACLPHWIYKFLYQICGNWKFYCGIAIKHKPWNNRRTSHVEECFWVGFPAVKLEIILKNALPQVMSDGYFKAWNIVLLLLFLLTFCYQQIWLVHFLFASKTFYSLKTNDWPAEINFFHFFILTKN